MSSMDVTQLNRVKSAVDACLHLLDAERPSAAPRETSLGAATTCVACRSQKSKCQPVHNGPCVRCQAKQIDCVFPELRRPGRKRANKKILLLQQAQRELCAFMGDQSWAERGPSGTAGSQAPATTQFPLEEEGSSVGEETEAKALGDILNNPLALLALASETVQPKTNIASPLVGTYNPHPDFDEAFDPVNLGLLTLDDLERLVDCYFTHMREFVWLLNREFHTPSRLRRISPFLTTVVACSAASYCPWSEHLVQGLLSHCKVLSMRQFFQGYKSMEIVQAYVLWLYWNEASTEDRTWTHLGQAIRTATDIRLDRPFGTEVYGHYFFLLGGDTVDPETLEAERLRTWGMVFSIEIGIAALTGRFQMVPSLPAPASRPEDERSPILLNYHATTAHARYFSKALQLHGNLMQALDGPVDTYQDQFNSSWKSDFRKWEAKWRDANYLIKIAVLDRRIMLLSSSLKFKGNPEPILSECQETALQAARLSVQWFASENSILYSSNTNLINIAYPANILLRLARGKFHLNGKLDEEIKDVCQKVSDLLTMVGGSRLHSASAATMFANQIRTQLEQLDSELDASLQPHVPGMGDFASGDLDMDLWQYISWMPGSVE